MKNQKRKLTAVLLVLYSLLGCILASCSNTGEEYEGYDVSVSNMDEVQQNGTLRDIETFSTEKNVESYDDVPNDVYEFAISYLKAREISCFEALQYVRYYGEYGDFMMQAWGNNPTWLEEWCIDRFERINDNLFVFFLYWKSGIRIIEDEIYTGPKRVDSGYLPYFVCLMDKEMFIVHALQFLPPGYGDGLNPENYEIIDFGLDPNDIIDVSDVVAFSKLIMD